MGTINIAEQDDVQVLQIEGELNYQSAAAARRDIQSALDNDARDFVINFSECTGIDSEGLELLTWLDRQCREQLGMCKLCMLDETLKTILSITRLANQLDTCDTPDDAFAALKST